MNEQEFKEFLQVVSKINRCPFCGRKYKKEDIIITGQRQNEFLVEFYCCRPLLANVALTRAKKPKISAGGKGFPGWKH